MGWLFSPPSSPYFPVSLPFLTTSMPWRNWQRHHPLALELRMLIRKWCITHKWCLKSKTQKYKTKWGFTRDKQKTMNLFIDCSIAYHQCEQFWNVQQWLMSKCYIPLNSQDVNSKKGTTSACCVMYFPVLFTGIQPLICYRISPSLNNLSFICLQVYTYFVMVIYHVYTDIRISILMYKVKAI